MRSPQHTYLGVLFMGPQLKTCFPTITQHGLWFYFPSKELVLPDSIPRCTIGIRSVDPRSSMIQRYGDSYCFIPTRLKQRECNLLCYNASFGASEQISNASSRYSSRQILCTQRPFLNQSPSFIEFGILSIQPQRGLNTPIFLFSPQSPLPPLAHLNKVDAIFQ